MGLTNITDPNKTFTIEEFISFKDDSTISYNNLSFRERYDNISYPIKNIVDDYYDELMKLTQEVTMNDTEFIKYRFRPRLLANDIYQNPDLDFIILTINDICNMKEFDNRTIKLIKVDDLENFLTSIFNANKNDIDVYNSTYDRKNNSVV